jgi:hypothetical protein
MVHIHDYRELVSPQERERRRARIAIMAIVLGAAAMGLVLWEYYPQFLATAGRGLPRWARPAFSEAAIVLALLWFIPLATLGLYLVNVGLKTIRAGRYPYPGMWRLRKAELKTGPDATQLARIALASGLSLLMLAPLTAWHFYALMFALLAPAR